MDRNLGASQVATSSTDSLAFGSLYQWGRGTDGHDVRTSATTGTASSGDQPGDGLFILNGSDWRSAPNNNLWQGVNGTNNPCPAGFRIPTFAELDAERASWSSQDIAGAFASPLKLTVAGDRRSYDGAVVVVGTWGSLWSSTVSGAGAIRLYFGSGSNHDAFVRAWGFSVRCIKD